MNWLDSRKNSWTCFVGIAFINIVLFFMSSCSVPTSADPSASDGTPAAVSTIASGLTDTPTPTSTPAATNIPTRLYPTPILVSPASGETINGTSLTKFFWQWENDLQEDERFDLQIWRSGKPSSSVSIRRECSCLLDTPPDGFGHYLWQVAVVRIDESGNKSRPLCESLIGSFDWIDVTPTLTHTATPTPTPTPIPDAVVKAQALNLRSGPGVGYDVLGVLKRGDPLKIRGRNREGDWVKVVAPGGTEGWVAVSCLEISIPLAGVTLAQAPHTPTPIYTPTPTFTPTPELLPPPILLEPENDTSFLGPVLLKWHWDSPLKHDEYFSLRVRTEGGKDCHHSQVQKLEYFGGLTHCSAGRHSWQVALVRKRCEDCPEHDKWQNLSEPSGVRWIRYTPQDQWDPVIRDDDDDDDEFGLGED